MVVVVRRGKSQEPLKQTVQRRCRFDVLAAHHVGDALQCVVGHHCNVITRSDMALGDHCVTPCGGLRVVSAAHVEAPAVNVAARDALLGLRPGQAPAGAAVMRLPVRIARRQGMSECRLA